MIRRLSLLLVLVAFVVLLPACGKKKTPPRPPSSTQASSTAPATDTPRAVAPPAPRSAPAEGDIWSADLPTLNEYLKREGLLGDVYFDYDQASLSDEAIDRLESNARFIKEHPELVVTIEGHCDERGTSEYNLALGERRAGAALSRVQSSGVAGGRLQRISYGKERPICEQNGERCWSLNRRAAFVVTSRLRTS
ncbi:MAG TPA: peptidoglycan-associated lipoprotein Pal [Thermoanaerobaculia bacterium]|nr:peptidoglycan-associated lipoprotein Pal [Thermoanaerobaculia bacterium]